MEFEAGIFRWVSRCFTQPTVFPDIDNQKDERLVPGHRYSLVSSRAMTIRWISLVPS